MVSDAYKIWTTHGKALMTLLNATLSTAALSCVIGCQTSKEIWTNLRERFADLTRTSILQLQNIKK